MGDAYQSHARHPFPSESDRRSSHNAPATPPDHPRPHPSHRPFLSEHRPQKRARADPAQQHRRYSVPNGAPPLRHDQFSWPDRQASQDTYRKNPSFHLAQLNQPQQQTSSPSVQNCFMQGAGSRSRRTLSRDRTIPLPPGSGPMSRPAPGRPAKPFRSTKPLQANNRSQNHLHDRKPGITPIAHPHQNPARSVPSAHHDDTSVRRNGSTFSHRSDSPSVSNLRHRKSEDPSSTVVRKDDILRSQYPDRGNFNAGADASRRPIPLRSTPVPSNDPSSSKRLPQLPDADAVGSTKPKTSRQAMQKSNREIAVDSDERPRTSKVRSASVHLPKGERTKAITERCMPLKRSVHKQEQSRPPLRLRSQPAPASTVIIPILKNRESALTKPDQHVEKQHVTDADVHDVDASFVQPNNENDADDAVQVVHENEEEKVAHDIVEQVTTVLEEDQDQRTTHDVLEIGGESHDVARTALDRTKNNSDEGKGTEEEMMVVVNLDGHDTRNKDEDVKENGGDSWPLQELQHCDRLDLKKILETQVARTQPHLNFSCCGMNYDDVMFILHLIRASSYIYSTSLSLHRNNLDVCSDSFFGELQALQVRILDLSMNRIRHVHSTVSRCQDLRVLDLSRNRLKDLPDTLCDLAELEVLDLTKNNIRELPRGFAKLKMLQTLNLSQNLLIELPGDWANEDMALSALDVSRNKNFEGFPTCTSTLKKVKDLHFSGTLFESGLRRADLRLTPIRLLREVAGKTHRELLARRRTKSSRIAKESNAPDVQTVDT